MKKLLIVLLFCLGSVTARADSVILMIGDGMGPNHLKCAAMDKPLYLTTLPVQGSIHTYSANAKITDSAASATAYSCGYKTNNSFLGKLPDKSNCTTLAERAVREGYGVGIYSTDHATGATPSAFYVHTTSRHDKKTILADKEKASAVMDIAVPVPLISAEVEPRLDKLSQANPKGFFVMFEGSGIDTFSHSNKLPEMKQELHDFDYAVMKAARYVYQHPDTTLIVLADHETGGLTDDCVYTKTYHTDRDILLYAYGQHADLFAGAQENTAVHDKIARILFPGD